MSTTAVVAVTRRTAGGATPSGGPGPVLPLAHWLAVEPAELTAHTWRGEGSVSGNNRNTAGAETTFSLPMRFHSLLMMRASLNYGPDHLKDASQFIRPSISSESRTFSTCKPTLTYLHDNYFSPSSRSCSRTQVRDAHTLILFVRLHWI